MLILRLCAIGCSPSEPAREQLDGGKVNPGLAAGGLCLEIFGQAAVAVEPGESSLDHPASWQELKSRGSIGPLDDHDLPLPVSGQSRRQLPAGIAAIGKDMAQPGEQVADRGEQSGRPITILDIAGVDPCRDEVPGGVGNDVALARNPERLAAIKARLVRNRDTAPLFDTGRFTGDLESAYTVMWERTQRGEPPESFSIEG